MFEMKQSKATPSKTGCSCGSCPRCNARGPAERSAPQRDHHASGPVHESGPVHRDRGPTSSSFGYAFRGDPPVVFGKDAGAPDAAPPASGLGSATPSVTWSGLNFSATATYSPCTDCRDGLEAIQVVWATGGPRRVGTFQTVFPPLAATYDSFVDGGVNSPQATPTYSGNHPYYIGRPDLPASYGHNGTSAGSVSGCTVTASDAPTAATLWQEVYFETVMVCLNYQGNGKDKLMNSISWGFTDLGRTHRAGPTDPSTTAVTRSGPTSDFEATLAADYPSYSHV